LICPLLLNIAKKKIIPEQQKESRRLSMFRLGSLFWFAPHTN